MRILMIHGIGQAGKNPVELKASWDRALREGFARINKPYPETVPKDFPFYGDKLEEFVNAPDAENIRMQGVGQNKEFEAFLKSALVEIKNNAQIADAEISAKLDSNIKTQDLQNWDWIRSIARVIDDRFIEVAEFTIETFLKDVFLYVNRPGITQTINHIVEQELTNEPTIVIGHSLGSVVGYKVILENLKSINLVKYITVGSPLGLRAISSTLGIPENPAVANGWFNAYDKKDIVALHPLNDKYFPTMPPVVNYDGVDNQTSNQHGIAGYLNNADVATAIHEVLRFC